ncbi:MAG TPA: Holliday junction resolvase RuvX [Propionibacteriaceae bacterium]|nr:Holliday junction resolvase RuvX [Propionibacteriaceae bacterium]
MRLALDLGAARIGVAACDRDGLLAYPVTTVPARPDPLPAIRGLVAEYEPVAVVVGLPVDLAGRDGPAARSVRVRAALIADAVRPVPVFLADERMTTATAASRLRASGRTSRTSRAVIDQAAAVAILEGVLDAERGGQAAFERATGVAQEEES